MFITEIFYNGQSLDLYADKGLKYNLQANDIAEIKDRQTSYTNSYDIPKTARNQRILGALGMASDTSPAPYTKPLCQVKIDGFDLIVKGWLNVKETDDTYKIYIYSGVIEFFKTIENKTLGKDLDLSELNHTKTPATVAASQTNTAYRYLLADYGGKMLTASGKINIDYQMPAVNFKYLWDKIHATFGFTYDCSVMGDMESLYMTYPKAINVNDQLEKQAELKAQGTLPYIPNLRYLFNVPDTKHHFFNFVELDVDHGYVADYGAANPKNGDTVVTTYGHFVAPASAYYKLDITGRVKVAVLPPSSGAHLIPQTLHLIKNAQNKRPIEAINQNNVIKSRVGLANLDQNGFDASYSGMIYLNAGESITLGFLSGLKASVTWQSDVTLTINRVINQDISFTDELSNFSITDFFKELLNMYGLTPFTSEHSRHISYKTLADRLKTPAKDWTAKYMSRSTETYVYDNYAQKNIFKYKYTQKEASYNDAALWVNNLNLKDQAIVYSSIFYSPEDFINTIISGAVTLNTNVFKMWDIELKNDGSVEYKNKDNRFYIMRAQLYESPLDYESGLSGQTAAVSSFYVGSFSRVSLQYFVDTYYGEFSNIAENSRKHKIDLYLNPVDILTLDLSSVIYFAQEQQYYIINKINFDEKRQSGEFIRILKPYELTDPVATEITIPVIYNSKETYQQSTSDYTFTLADLDPVGEGFTDFKFIAVPTQGFLHTANFTGVQTDNIISAADVASGALQFKAEGAYNNMSTLNYSTNFVVQGILASGAMGGYVNVIINTTDLLDGDDEIIPIPVSLYCFRAYRDRLEPTNPDPTQPSYGYQDDYIDQPSNTAPSYGQVTYTDAAGVQQTAYMTWQEGIVQIEAQTIIYTNNVTQVTCP